MLTITMAAFLATSGSVRAQEPIAHLCWIDRVEAEGLGVRVFFVENAPVRPDQRSVHGEIGVRLPLANSGHDGCSISVAKKGRTVGVQVEAHLFVPHVMAKPEVRREWIRASANR